MYIEIVESDCDIYVCMYGIVVCCIGMYVLCTEWVAGCIMYICSVYCCVLVSVFG